MYHVQWIALISAKRWRLDVLTFLIHGFELIEENKEETIRGRKNSGNDPTGIEECKVNLRGGRINN